MTGTICATPECKSSHGKHENFEVFLNSPKFSEVAITQNPPKFYTKSFEMFFEIF